MSTHLPLNVRLGHINSRTVSRTHILQLEDDLDQRMQDECTIDCFAKSLHNMPAFFLYRQLHGLHYILVFELGTGVGRF
jgi:hypothetical protein